MQKDGLKGLLLTVLTMGLAGSLMAPKTLISHNWGRSLLWVYLALTFAATAAVPISVSADNSSKQTAILVDGYSSPHCNGMDCPPWRVPPNTDFCFQVGTTFYTAISRPWGVPWASNGERLLALKGEPVEITATDKDVKVEAPGISLRLRRVHKDPLFSIDACKQA